MSLGVTNPQENEVETRVARRNEMADAIAVRITPEQKVVAIDAGLYDEAGLPK